MRRNGWPKEWEKKQKKPAMRPLQSARIMYLKGKYAAAADILDTFLQKEPDNASSTQNPANPDSTVLAAEIAENCKPIRRNETSTDDAYRLSKYYDD